MAYRLAELSGELDVRALMRRTSAKQAMGWERYFALEPIVRGDRTGHYAALVASTIANVNRGKDREPFTLDDFLLKLGEPKARPKQSAEQKVSIAYAIAASYTASDKDL